MTTNNRSTISSESSRANSYAGTSNEANNSDQSSSDGNNSGQSDDGRRRDPVAAAHPATAAAQPPSRQTAATAAGSAVRVPARSEVRADESPAERAAPRRRRLLYRIVRARHSGSHIVLIQSPASASCLQQARPPGPAQVCQVATVATDCRLVTTQARSFSSPLCTNTNSFKFENNSFKFENTKETTDKKPLLCAHT